MKQQETMSDSRQKNTYMLFTKKGRGIAQIAGPLFEHEIQKSKNKNFPNKKVHVVEETSFAALNPKRYKQHITTAWFDKLYCYFTLNGDWVGEVRVSQSNKYCEGSWFAMFEQKDSEGSYFQVSPQISANPFYIARLKQDLIDMGFSIISGELYYREGKTIIHVGKDAISRSLAVEMVKHMCLS
jgi:hypothetical protein